MNIYIYYILNILLLSAYKMHHLNSPEIQLTYLTTTHGYFYLQQRGKHGTFQIYLLTLLECFDLHN